MPEIFGQLFLNKRGESGRNVMMRVTEKQVTFWRWSSLSLIISFMRISLITRCLICPTDAFFWFNTSSFGAWKIIHLLKQRVHERNACFRDLSGSNKYFRFSDVSIRNGNKNSMNADDGGFCLRFLYRLLLNRAVSGLNGNSTCAAMFSLMGGINRRSYHPKNESIGKPDLGQKSIKSSDDEVFVVFIFSSGIFASFCWYCSMTMKTLQANRNKFSLLQRNRVLFDYATSPTARCFLWRHFYDIPYFNHFLVVP